MKKLILTISTTSLLFLGGCQVEARYNPHIRSSFYYPESESVVFYPTIRYQTPTYYQPQRYDRCERFERLNRHYR